MKFFFRTRCLFFRSKCCTFLFVFKVDHSLAVFFSSCTAKCTWILVVIWRGAERKDTAREVWKIGGWRHTRSRFSKLLLMAVCSVQSTLTFIWFTASVMSHSLWHRGRTQPQCLIIGTHRTTVFEIKPPSEGWNLVWENGPRRLVIHSLVSSVTIYGSSGQRSAIAAEAIKYECSLYYFEQSFVYFYICACNGSNGSRMYRFSA